MALAPPPRPLSPVGVRLCLAAQPEHGRMPRPIDGAWWPRSYDLTAELPRLLAGLPRSWGRIEGVLVDGAEWSPFPGRLLVAGEVVRLRRTTARHAPPTVCLVAPGRGRWDLVVVPPTATEEEAARLMQGAAGAVGDGVV
ncbi:DUF5994 family protein [Streptomyces sp. NPDC059466]|uniref:DUF5994 family protein n=1 Tax=unclassified Streptomyces TaxID=2593676 RepID=UPI0036909EA2